MRCQISAPRRMPALNSPRVHPFCHTVAVRHVACQASCQTIQQQELAKEAMAVPNHELLPASVVLKERLPVMLSVFPGSTGYSCSFRAYPGKCVHWEKFEESAVNHQYPDVLIPPLPKPAGPVASTDEALAAAVGTMMVPTLNQILLKIGSSARWVPYKFKPGVSRLESMTTKQPQFVLSQDGQMRGFIIVARRGDLQDCAMPDTRLWQATNFAALHGIRYGAVMSWHEGWVVKFTEPGNMVMPYKMNDHTPRWMQALWYMTELALAPRAQMGAWKPAAARWPYEEKEIESSKWQLQGVKGEYEIACGKSGYIVGATLADGRKVAVKHSADPEIKDVLEHEAQVITKLSHLPDPVRLAGHGLTPGRHSYWLATELLPGRTLDVDKYPEDIKLWPAAALGLERIHEAGYIHGNLMRENIIIDHDAQQPVRFLDFALAQASIDPQKRKIERSSLAALFNVQ